MPLFSIIIPVYNRAHLIRDCIDSIFAQRLQDFEIIVVDNNSTDDLVAVLSDYNDPRLIVTRCAIPGPSAARMCGVKLSNGLYLSFIDSDDIWKDDVLQVVSAALSSPTPSAAVYLAATYFRADCPINWDAPLQGEVTTTATLLQALWIGAPGACALAGVRREYFEDGEGFDEALWVGEDLDWALRHAFIGPVCLLRDRARLGYRRHDDNITKDARRYAMWARQLIGFARCGRYKLDDSHSFRFYIVSHLMGQIATLMGMSSYASVLRLYPRIFLLGIHWGIWRPLFMTELFAAFFGDRWRQFKKYARKAL